MGSKRTPPGRVRLTQSAAFGGAILAFEEGLP